VALQAGKIADFVAGLGKNWSEGEQRSIHRRPYVRRKPVPRRSSMLDRHVDEIERWLATTPHLTAVDVLNRLHETAPDEFGGKQRRTLQRFVQSWRARTAKLLIDGAEATIAIDLPSALPIGEAHGPKLLDPEGQFGNATP